MPYRQLHVVQLVVRFSGLKLKLQLLGIQVLAALVRPSIFTWYSYTVIASCFTVSQLAKIKFEAFFNVSVWFL